MEIIVKKSCYTDVLILEDVIKKAFPHYEGQELSNTDILETENYLFIATHRKIGNHYLQEYFMVAIYKHLFNEVVYKNQNCIDYNKYHTALEVKEYTGNYLKHLIEQL